MKPINIEGFTPLKDDAYKLLLNNVFTIQELGMISTALAHVLVDMSKAKKLKLEEQKETCAGALGKILLAMPEHYRVALVKTFKSSIGLDLNLQEVQLNGIKH